MADRRAAAGRATREEAMVQADMAAWAERTVATARGRAMADYRAATPEEIREAILAHRTARATTATVDRKARAARLVAIQVLVMATAAATAAALADTATRAVVEGLADTLASLVGL